jgi:hypothetical protein
MVGMRGREAISSTPQACGPLFHHPHPAGQREQGPRCPPEPETAGNAAGVLAMGEAQNLSLPRSKLRGCALTAKAVWHACQGACKERASRRKLTFGVSEAGCHCRYIVTLPHPRHHKCAVRHACYSSVRATESQRPAVFGSLPPFFQSRSPRARLPQAVRRSSPSQRNILAKNLGKLIEDP